MYVNFIYFSPLEQFEILPLLSGYVSANGGQHNVTAWVLTNSDLVMGIGMIEVFFLLGLLGSTRLICSAVFSYRVLQLVGGAVDMVAGMVGRVGQSHTGIVLTLGIFVILFNLLGLVPFGFCVTSHIVVTQLLGGFAVGGLTLKGVQNLGFRWLNLFVPRNVPMAMLPFLSLIEIISYVSRALSLSIRLFANMVAGHALLHILLGALLNVLLLPIGGLGILLIFGIPTVLILAIVALELGIAFLQGYVFITLYLMYMSDALFSH